MQSTETIDKFNYNVLFLGGVIPRNIETIVLSNSKSGYQYAANEFQWSLISGFDILLTRPCTLINRLFIGSYPKNYKKPIVKGFKFSHIEDAKINKDVNLGFINIAIIKQFIRPFFEKREIKRWISDSKESPRVIFIYSFGKNTYQLARKIKQIDKNCIIVVSVNDLPQYTMMTKKQTVLKSLWMKHVQKLSSKSIEYIDGFMLVSKFIANELHISNKPNVVVEGLVNIENYKFNNVEPTKRFKENLCIVYTGGINKFYGVKDLLEAFSKVKRNDVSLILCGEGDLLQTVKEYSIIDQRIKYLGVLPHEQIVEIQNSATILVNPRKNVSAFTRYSFPIKTVEYLIAGCPVIGYKLDGIPQEYYEYIISPSDTTIERLTETIENIFEMSEKDLTIMGEKNQKFITYQKNNVFQVQKILNMVKKIIMEENNEK